ncbi:hypothetical protein [Nitrospina watsonii]|uniref:Deoxyhypusine synthase n=1 Tax=Nitrospina watsonii TaxID=1323948 RepID=A0ABM9HA90_9BACT|nr:hypothetical protein [Nitrospina watsonii]CAI2717036.1 conserved protein of unknown function [Nitrospina watsonii]
MPSPSLNLTSLKIKPLAERQHDLKVDCIHKLEKEASPLMVEVLKPVAHCLMQAKETGRARILMMGAHVLRSGVQRYLIDLMERGYLDCLAFNGAGIIHDYEFARIGATTESVARYIQTGEFGFWQETAELNDIVNAAYRKDPEVGLGQAVGRAILDSDYPHKDISLFAAAARLGIPATVHVCIGQDIIHQHPNFDGAATGALSYTDFLKYAACVRRLEGGVVMNFGSAVMAPEVYLKALSMARNLAHQEHEEVRRFTTLVCDLHDLPSNFKAEAPKSSSGYYYRPWKTMLVRTVADGGDSHYVKGVHAETVPALWQAIQILEHKTGQTR